MKHRDIENRLALLGALVVLVGVTSAATSALADDAVTMERTTAVSARIAEITAADGRRANRSIADAAARAIARKTISGLDIELANRTSKEDAGAG